MTEEKLSDKHEVLYHYTTMSGFRGIMDTQTLWATQHKHLNDLSELKCLTPIVTKILLREMKRIIKNIVANGNSGDKKKIKTAIKRLGSRHAFARNAAELGPVDNHLAAIMPAARFQFAM